jgi:hypothetical protein
MDASTRAGPEASYNYTMEVLGYHVRKGLGRPNQEIVDGVENEIDALCSQSAPSEAASTSVKGGPRCTYFIEHGLDVSSSLSWYYQLLITA